VRLNVNVTLDGRLAATPYGAPDVRLACIALAGSWWSKATSASAGQRQVIDHRRDACGFAREGERPLVLGA
jgi:hypothetical protein